MEQSIVKNMSKITPKFLFTIGSKYLCSLAIKILKQDPFVSISFGVDLLTTFH